MQLLYGAILSLIKISICLFYIRIFFVRPFRIATWIVIGFISCWGVMVFLTGLLMCTPIAFNWDQTIPGGKCADQRATFMAVGVLDLVTDLCVFVLPLPMIWKLQVSIGNKISLFGIFGLGIMYVFFFPDTFPPKPSSKTHVDMTVLQYNGYQCSPRLFPRCNRLQRYHLLRFISPSLELHRACHRYQCSLWPPIEAASAQIQLLSQPSFTTVRGQIRAVRTLDGSVRRRTRLV